MPTHTDKKSKTGESVPSAPKSFSPQVRDGSGGNAWDSFRALSEGPARGNLPIEEMFALARSSIQARQIRKKHLPDPMFGEPAWDMLLSLYVDARSNARQTVSTLSKSSGAPATTALRWIDYLERHEFVTRRSSPTDKRIAFIELSIKGRDAIEAYLTDLLEQGMATPTRA